jgi:hypothetical protein
MDTPEQEPNIVADTPPVAFLVPEGTFEFPEKYYREAFQNRDVDFD